MKQALRSGIPMMAFWEMTPKETYATIDAANWREEKHQERGLVAAWLNAALSRSKRMPSLQSLMTSLARPKRLTRNQLRERRQEFKEIATAEKIRRINEAMSKKQ